MIAPGELTQMRSGTEGFDRLLRPDGDFRITLTGREVA